MLTTTPLSPPNKKRKLEPVTEKKDEPQRWVQHGDIMLATKDKMSITVGEMLNDEHINLAQQLLRR